VLLAASIDRALLLAVLLLLLLLMLVQVAAMMVCCREMTGWRAVVRPLRQLPILAANRHATPTLFVVHYKSQCDERCQKQALQ
jgi:hypothetical protein